LASTSNNELAEIAAQLLNDSGSGALATVSAKHDGFPFASHSAFSAIANQQSVNQQSTSTKLPIPIFLFSDLSVHSKNLRKNTNATLLIKAGNEMQQGRASIMGIIERLDEKLVDQARQSYLAKHPDAAQWMSFGDFHFYAMAIVDCYVVAGFGKAGWVKQ